MIVSNRFWIKGPSTDVMCQNAAMAQQHISKLFKPSGCIMIEQTFKGLTPDQGVVWQSVRVWDIDEDGGLTGPRAPTLEEHSK